jgi:hypothetical protein
MMGNATGWTELYGSTVKATGASGVEVAATTGHVEVCAVDASGLIIVRTGSTTAARALEIGQFNSDRARWWFYGGPTDVHVATMDVTGASMALTGVSGKPITIAATSALLSLQSTGHMEVGTNTGLSLQLGRSNKPTTIWGDSLTEQVTANATRNYGTASSKAITTRNVTGRGAREEEHYGHVTTTSTGAVTMTDGTWSLPSGFTDGIVHTEMHLMGTSADHSEAYDAIIHQTWTVLAGAATQVGTPTVTAEKGSVIPSIAAIDWSSPTFRMRVRASNAETTGWEAWVKARYAKVPA